MRGNVPINPFDKDSTKTTGDLILLDNAPEVKELLIAFAFFALNFERLIERIKALCVTVSPETNLDDKSGGAWIRFADNLILNNYAHSHEELTVWKEILSSLWQINNERVRIVKGAKYYQLVNREGARFVTFGSHGGLDEKYLTTKEIYDAEQRCAHLEQVIAYVSLGVEQGVDVAKIVEKVDDRFTINLKDISVTDRPK